MLNHYLGFIPPLVRMENTDGGNQSDIVSKLSDERESQ